MKKFRKFISLLLTIIFLLSASPLISADVFAETVSGTAGDNITWSYDTETKVLSFTGSGAMDDYTFINRRKTPWIDYESDIKEIIIGDGITHTGGYCFYNYSSVESVTLPETMTDIGDSSFGYCKALTEINFPDSIISIGSSAFSGCSNLSDFSFPSSLKRIGSSAFRGTAITAVEIPLTLESLGANAFGGSALESYVSGPNIKNVQISNGSSLKELRYADDITVFEVYDYPFEELTLPDTVESFSLSGFNIKLKRLTLSNSIRKITQSGAGSLKNLEYFYIPKSVVWIDDYAIKASNTVYCYENTAAYDYVVANNIPYVSLGVADTDYSPLIEQFERYDDYDFSQYSQISVEHLTASYIADQAALEATTQAEVNAAWEDMEFRYNHLFKARGIVTGTRSGLSNPDDGCDWLLDIDKGLLIIDGYFWGVGIDWVSAPWLRYKPVIYDIIITDGSRFTNNGFYSGYPYYEPGVLETVTCYGTVYFMTQYLSSGVGPLTGSGSGYTIYCTEQSPTVIETAIASNRPYVIIDSNLKPQISIADYSSCSVNDEGRTIDGLSPMMTGEQVLADGVGGNGYTAEIETSSDYVGTGSTVILKSDDTGKVLDEYAFVLYGDLNGDGVYDGQDATLASAVSNGMLTEDDIGSPAIFAADCNHDGAVDDMDIAVMQQAGVLLAQIDQSKSGGELTTDSSYQDYVSLIDQTPDAEDATVEEPSDEPAEQSDTGFNLLTFLQTLVTRLVSYIKTLLSILK